VTSGLALLASAPASVGPARRREVGKGRGNAAGSDLREAYLNHTLQRCRPDWTGTKRASAARKGLEGIAPGPAGFGDSTGRARGSDGPGRRRRATLLQSNELLAPAKGEGDWVLAIGPTMAATPGAEGESWTRPSGQESAEARARRQSRAKVAGGRGFIVAKAAVKRVTAGNRVQGASIALRRSQAPGMKEASCVDARQVESVLGSEAPKSAARATRVSEAIVPNRLGKAEEAPKRVWMGEGRNENGARELAESPDDRTRTLKGAAVTIPLEPRSAEGRGNARAVTEARCASSNALRHEGVSTGFGPPGVPRRSAGKRR